MVNTPLRHPMPNNPPFQYYLTHNTLRGEEPRCNNNKICLSSFTLVYKVIQINYIGILNSSSILIQLFNIHIIEKKHYRSDGHVLLVDVIPMWYCCCLMLQFNWHGVRFHLSWDILIKGVVASKLIVMIISSLGLTMYWNVGVVSQQDSDKSTYIQAGPCNASLYHVFWAFEPNN